MAAAAGVAAGFGLFFVLRIPLAAIPFTGEPFFPGDLSLSLPDILGGRDRRARGGRGRGPAGAAAGDRSPRSGVTRRVTPEPPRAWRVLPLLAGLAWLGFFVVHGRPASVPGQIQALLPGFLLIMIGLIIAGPWLTMTGARIMARRASRPGALIAARRLADDPRAGVPRGQRPGPGAVHHHRGRRGHHHPGRQGGPPGRLGRGLQCPGRRPGRPAAAVLRPGLESPLTAAAPARTLAPLLARLGRIHGVEAVIAVRADGASTLPRALLGGSDRRVPLGVSGDRPRSRRPGAVLGAGPRSRPRPLPRRRGGRVVPQVPGRCPARQEPRQDHLAGRGRPRPRLAGLEPGQHRHRDGRIAVSGRAGQDRAGETRTPTPASARR